MNSFFEKWGYPETMKKQPKPSKSGIQKIYESEIYKEFKELRGENKTQLMLRNPTKKEIAAWESRQHDYLDVKNILTFLRANLLRASNRGDASQKIEVSLDYVYMCTSITYTSIVVIGISVFATASAIAIRIHYL